MTNACNTCRSPETQFPFGDVFVGAQHVPEQRRGGIDYRQQGTTLFVNRVLEDRTPGNVCSPKVFMEYRKVAERVLENFREQVLDK